jgi:hypothetical protein
MNRIAVTNELVKLAEGLVADDFVKKSFGEYLPSQNMEYRHHTVVFLQGMQSKPYCIIDGEALRLSGKKYLKFKKYEDAKRFIDSYV